MKEQAYSEAFTGENSGCINYFMLTFREKQFIFKCIQGVGDVNSHLCVYVVCIYVLCMYKSLFYYGRAISHAKGMN